MIDHRNPPPAPGTCHPSLEGHAAWVGRWLSDNPNQPFVLPAHRRPAWAIADDGLASTPRELGYAVVLFTPSQAVGPAPFVGDPLVQSAEYAWRVASDAYGRHVATEAVLRWR